MGLFSKKKKEEESTEEKEVAAAPPKKEVSADEGGAMSVTGTTVLADTNLAAVVSGAEGRILVHAPFHHSPMVSFWNGGEMLETWDVSYEGSGYRFEVEHFQDCLAQGRTESPIRPLDETLAIMQVMDEVRGQRRSTRRGYRIEATTAGGDSGAGLYDRRGRLAGLVFAVSAAGSARTWVTAESEIADFLDEFRGRGEPEGAFICHPARSRIEPIR